MNTSRIAGVAALALAVTTFAPPAQSQTGGMRSYGIVDPVLKQTAWTLSVPDGWNADGTMMPGSTCNGSTSPIYRATSADGGTGVYQLPREDWTWGGGVRPGKDCLPWAKVVSAKDFLTYRIGVDKVQFVRAMAAPRAPAMTVPGYTSDAARYLVRYSVNGRPVDELLSATTVCHAATMVGLGMVHSCSAFVTRWFAPAGTVEGLVPTFDAMHLTLNQQWMSAWTAMTLNAMRQRSAAQTQAMLAQGRLAQAQRDRAHANFMASFQRGADIRNQQFAASQYRKQNNNDNEVDYILGCQRAYSGNSRVSAGTCPNRQTF
jgi:hypothetical protein